MFKLAYNANGLRALNAQSAVRTVALAGYQGIELSLHPSHIAPWEFSSAAAASLLALARDNGIELCALATGADTLLGPERFEPSLIHPLADGRQKRTDLLRWAIDLAVAMEIPTMSFASGIRKPEVDVARAQDLLLEGVMACLEHASGAVTLAIEPEPGFFIETNRQAGKLMEQAPGLRLNQDIGHACVCEDDYLVSFADSLPRTAHIHMEDIKDRRHYHEVPGDGGIDFVEAFRRLRLGQYAAFLSVELYNHGDKYSEAMDRSLRYLRQEEARSLMAA